jgi:uncharacterized protein (DUF4415 family)
VTAKIAITYELNPERPARLTAAQKVELEALTTLLDDQIDTSDIRRVSETFWRNAVPNPFFRPVKQQVTVRLDADVLAWLRSTGRGYQSRLNDILRQAIVRTVGQRRGSGPAHRGWPGVAGPLHRA